MYRTSSPFFFIFALLGSTIHSHAATFKWSAPNSLIERIEFYTVYIDSPLEGFRQEVRESSFSLNELLPNINYTLSVSATSIEGVESKRSATVPYIVGFPLPTIISHPHPATLILASDTPLILSVEAASPLGVKYEWDKDNCLLPNQSLPLLSILSPTPADSGNYTAVVSTPGGHVESQSAQVIVQDRPYVNVQPTSDSLPVGAQFIFSVNASGTDLSYQWYKAGQPIPDATNLYLFFPELNSADKGSYRVSIRNFVGEIVSEIGVLDVFHLPVSFTGPHSTNLLEGETLNLTVDITGGSSPFTFHWTKNGLQLDWATNATLEISSVGTNDSGLYRVSVANPISFVPSAPAKVTILPLPRILTMNVTDTGFLRITAVASPRATYELQSTDSLSNPNWVRLQDANAAPDGSFEFSILPNSQFEFIRTMQK
jgi:hypothetical protein